MPTANLVQVTSLDSIRIDILGEGRALTIPVECVLAADRMMRGALVEDDDVSIYEAEHEDGSVHWRAELGNWFGLGQTPWQAVIELAKRIPIRH